MNAATIVKMIDTRRNNTPYEDYAHLVGLKTSALYRYLREGGKRDLSISNLRKLVDFYTSQGDTEMAEALVSYVAGRPVKLSD